MNKTLTIQLTQKDDMIPGVLYVVPLQLDKIIDTEILQRKGCTVREIVREIKNSLQRMGTIEISDGSLGRVVSGRIDALHRKGRLVAGHPKGQGYYHVTAESAKVRGEGLEQS